MIHQEAKISPAPPAPPGQPPRQGRQGGARRSPPGTLRGRQRGSPEPLLWTSNAVDPWTSSPICILEGKKEGLRSPCDFHQPRKVKTCAGISS